MERRTFIAISAAASMALAASCASFSEGTESGSDAGPATPDAGAAGDADSGTIPDGAVADATDAGLGAHECTGTVVIDDPFEQSFTQTGWILQGTPVADGNVGAPPPSVFAEIPILTSGEQIEHAMRRELPLNGNTSVCIELDVRLEQVGGSFTADGYAEVLEVSSGARSLFAEMRSSDGFSFTDDTTSKKLAGFKFKEWQHLVMKLRYDSVTAPTLGVAGVSPITGEGPLGVDVPSNITVHIGLDAKGQGGSAGAMRVNIDNFRFASSP